MMGRAGRLAPQVATSMWQSTYARWALLANAGLLIVVVATMATLIHRDYKETERLASLQAQSFGDVLAEHTHQKLAALDATTFAIVQSVTSRPALLSAPRLLNGVLEQQHAALPSSSLHYVLDASGRLIASSEAVPPAQHDFSTLAEFQAHVTGAGPGLVVAPSRQGLDGWYFDVTRRIDGPDGALAGVVGARVPMSYLLALYDTLQLPDGVVALLSREGVLIARSPFQADRIGLSFIDKPLFRKYLPGAERGLYTGTYRSDGVRRMVAFNRVPEFRVVLTVGIGECAVMAEWRERSTLTAGLSLAVLLLFGMLSYRFALSMWLRRRQEERKRQRAEFVARATGEMVRAKDAPALLLIAADTSRQLAEARFAAVSVRTAIDGKPLQACSPDVCGEAAAREDVVGEEIALRLPGGEEGDIGSLSLLGSQREDHAETVSDLVQFATVVSAVYLELQQRQDLALALRSSEQARAETDTVLASISDGMYALNCDWEFTYVNAAAERMLRRSRDTLLGRTIWDAFPAVSGTELEHHYRACRLQRTAVSFEFYYPPLSTWFSVRAFPSDMGLTSYFQDVTLRVEAEARLRHAQKMESIGKLTGGIAHDFNNLMTVVLGNAEDLLDELPAEWANARESAEQIELAGRRASELTHSLLAFARKQPLSPEPLELGREVQGMRPLLLRTLGEQIELEVELMAPQVTVEADRAELQHAILNLVINAREAMPDGGVLLLRVTRVELTASAAVDLDLAPGSYAVLTVADDGCGMCREEVERAFDPFFTTKPGGQGAGLGLSMVYGFVRQSGGTAQISSTPCKGTAVTLYLPCSALAPVLPLNGEREHVAGGGECILVIEDDAALRHYVAKGLSTLGYSVRACANGDEALVELARAVPDLVLTDVMLRGRLSGSDVAVAIRHMQPEMPVLFMSGYSDEVLIEQGRLVAGVNLLAKPFRMHDLAAAVRRLLAARH